MQSFVFNPCAAGIHDSIAKRTDDGVAIERKGGAVDGSATRLSPRDNPSRITYSDDASYVLVDVNPERPT